MSVKVRPGYACINLSIGENFKSFRRATVEKKEVEKLTKVLHANIRLLRKIIEYNVAHQIYVYRLTSDLIPFCSHPLIKALSEEVIFQNNEMLEHLGRIRALKSFYNLRLSIHPGQFNVLASPKKEVVERSIEEINAQTKWMKELEGDNVVLHVGGVYGNKKEALKRFEENLAYVDTELLSIENDDKCYSVEDIWPLCNKLGLKWVYDYHHDRCYPSQRREVSAFIKAYPPHKYHLSTGTPQPHQPSHADYISKEDYKAFTAFLETIGIREVDVIFEAKKKNLAITHLLKPIGGGYWVMKD
ncbi:UV damage repair endonuclease UvsE [Sporanaerobium hydrogeniformans]|uniref:UV damage repair endonuclease UvsE n=1 Tax=Sporanaerobium hydrogeniformans TaxID=3072179 RepID=A0AC61DDU9_9FIRM|nr:UV DNA damage repair endonuclease UvsE [Sporanaerobium hydrogeniformans]PHV70901.1 UV damage repair endonuclease UvsE [Sporanaerobium hydrogeniformans]